MENRPTFELFQMPSMILPTQHKRQPTESAENHRGGPRYWKSLDELAETPEFRDWVEREFPAGASEIEGFNRRHFLKIMAASFAFAGAGMSGCRRPEQHILPYSKQPENVVPGVPVYFSTSLPSARDNIPLVVKTHQNRPTKIEGNPAYSPYGGSTNLQAQASILDLYDPDRSSASKKGSQELSRAEVEAWLDAIGEKYLPTQGQGLAILAEGSVSPTRQRLVKALRKRFPRSIWAEYDAIEQNNAESALARILGKRLRPRYNLKNARRILSLDADFLNCGPGHLQLARDFSGRRKVREPAAIEKMSRLYMAESHFSTTGAMADHRLRLPSSHIPALAALTAAELLEKLGKNPSLAALLRRKAAGLKVDSAWVGECVADLVEHRGEAIIMAGEDQPSDVHQLVYFANDLLSANGKTVNYLELPEKVGVTLQDLAEAIQAGRVETLFILGGNPAYNAPGDLHWADLQRTVDEVIRYGYYEDETSALSLGHIAAAHYLESWGDGRAWDGVILPVQPMILPLFDGFQEIAILARLAGLKETDPYVLVRETFATLTGKPGSDRAFERFLSDGLLENSGYARAKVAINRGALQKNVAGMDLPSGPFSKENLEIRITADPKVLDGRYANNGWLQECPDPMTKITWDNVISISPQLARELSWDPHTPRSPVSRFLKLARVSAKRFNEFKMGRQVAPVGTLSVNGTAITGPINVQPGLADYTVALTTGYGRVKSGRVGDNVGFSAYPLFSSQSGGIIRGARLELTGTTHNLANTQEHWSMEGRAIIREANVTDFQKDPHFVEKLGMEAHSPPILGSAKDESLQNQVLTQPRGNSLYITPTFGGAQQWGMSIDLNACTGCSACVVACQSENNIPIVGQDQVARGREMHWIRLDRYFSSGDVELNKSQVPDDPQVSVAPIPCMHCEMAPCEQVCPVNATVHDSQGLNVMAYNRCVGTRYCANNCPYKVRRFNFFDWNKREIDHFYEGPLGPAGKPEIKSLQKNPEVTIRMRGVMEKCTYCQQRIDVEVIKAKVAARDSGDVKVRDGAIKTACQQVCPTGAIVFGDVADADSEVSKIKNSDLNYGILGYLNTRPRTTYLARLRNPNPLMPDYKTMPLSRMEYEKLNVHGAAHGEDAEHGDGGHH